MKKKHFISCFLLIYLILACKKESRDSLSFQETKIFKDAIPSGISFSDTKTGFISSTIEPSVNSACVAKTEDAGVSWRILPVYVDNSPTSVIRSIYAKSNEVIYATFNTRNDFCGICKSSDGGLTWKSTFKTNIIQPYTGLLVRENDAFVCRGGGDILRSTDDCISWEIVYKHDSFFGGIGKLFFTSNKIGFAYGGHVGDFGSGTVSSFGTLLKTTDGGSTWTELHSISAFITSLLFKNSNEGYAFTFNNEVYKTIDGGINWVMIKDLYEGASFASISIQDKIFYTNGGPNLYQSDINFKNIKKIFTSKNNDYSSQVLKIDENSALFLSSSSQYVLKLNLK